MMRTSPRDRRRGTGLVLITMQSGPQVADVGDVRATNLMVVLRHVRAHQPCSRADIAAATGLTKATVSSLVADLIDRRLLRETGLTVNRIGRPATMLVLDGAAYAAIGLEVGADHLSAVSIDLAGERLLSWRRSFAGPSATPGRAISAIAALAHRAATRVAAQGRQVLGLTVGVPGLVDADGCVRLAPSLGWRDVDLRGELTRALRRPPYEVAVENDANLCALAEQRYGVEPGVSDLVFLTGQHDIGAGVIADGRLLRGHRGFGGELGHVQLDPGGPPCRCGRRGCFEAVAGVAAIIRRVVPDAEADGPLIDFAPEIDRVAMLARQQDPAALAALRQAGTHIGHALSLVAHLADPRVAVLGGYFAPLAPWLLPPAEAELTARATGPGGCRLAVSALHDPAAAVGGAARSLDAVDAGRLPTAVAPAVH